jgi:hypothetical protein
MSSTRRSASSTESALRAGYSEVRRLPDLSTTVFEALVASRQLLLANDLLTSTTQHLRAQADGYLERALGRLRHWRDGGTFRLDPETRHP